MINLQIIFCVHLKLIKFKSKCNYCLFLIIIKLTTKTCLLSVCLNINLNCINMFLLGILLNLNYNVQFIKFSISKSQKLVFNGVIIILMTYFLKRKICCHFQWLKSASYFMLNRFTHSIDHLSDETNY